MRISNKKNKNYEDVLERGKDLIEFYNNNPCVAAYDLLGIDLAPIQRLVFEDMWFKNYVIVIAGRGFGKSIDISNLCHFKDKGLVYLHEELPPIPSWLSDGEEEVINWDQEIYTSEGFRNTKRLCLEKGIEGKELITKNNFSNRGSNHHSLLTLNENCEFVYKKLEDLVSGDRLCIQREQLAFGNNELPLDDAYILGLLTGDDHVVHDTSLTSADEYIISFSVNYCNNNNVNWGLSYKSGGCTCEFRFLKGFSLIEKYNIPRTPSYDKSVPYSIRTATKEAHIAFLQGYFDTDGTVHNTNGGVSCCSVSKKLLQEIQLMLLNFGIVSRLRKKKTKSKFGKAYLLDIFSVDAFKFKELIGFRLERKQKVLDDYFENKEMSVNKDTVPYALGLCHSIIKHYHSVYKTSKKPSFRIHTGNKKELSYGRLRRFLIQCEEVEGSGFSLDGVRKDIDKLYTILEHNYYFDTVESLSDWKGDCYDFEMDMEGEPNYFSNGFINHNTFLLGTLATLSCLLKPGYRVGLIGPVFRQSFVISDTYDTSFTSSGMKSTIKDLYSSVVPNITQIQSLDSQNTILSKWENDDRACRWIKTTKGFEIAGTCDHGILVLNDNNNLVFKELQDIKSDYIAIKTGFNYFANNDSMPKFDEFEHNWRTKDCVTPKELTPDLAYWMGLLVGDGCVSVSKNKRKQRVSFVSEDQDLLDSFENYLREYFLLDKDENISRRNRKNNTWEMEYFCKKLVQYLLKCGFTKTTALDKKVPAIIKKASREIFVAFLQGLFDTDGGVYIQDSTNACEVSFNTSSLQLAKEVHAILLNLGIISNLSISTKACIKKLSQGNKPSKCSTGYKIRITGKEFLCRFNDIVGFRCLRKKEKLGDYLNNYLSSEFGIARTLGLPSDKVDESYMKFYSYMEQGLYFVKMVDNEYMFAPSIDIEVEKESCYWANGFINHNSKMIFSEIEKLYTQSSILREACERKPIKASDACYLRFKAVGGMTPSYIEALPLGTDGSKIRGSRFYLILADELAQIPDQVLDMVVRPMSATSLAPMERVRRLEQQERLIKLGVATAEDFEEETVNKMVMTSSGYYKFNHMWRRMKDHWTQMEISERKGEVCKYAVWQVPYQDLPSGFLDDNNISEAKRIMSNAEFRMEYEAAMISDSEGFFKASLLDSCTVDSGHTIEFKGERGHQYILGIDPNQGGKASTGIAVVKLGAVNRIVSMLELKKKNTPELTKIVQGLCKNFNVLRIFMDKGGGGKAISDLLMEGYGGEEPIIDRTNDDYRHLKGRHILELVNFNPVWISDANFTTKSMLEDKKILFPETPVSTLEDMVAKRYEAVNTLKSQMLNIIVTQTPSGSLHFDTPTKGQNKDLYSAIILAAHGARMLEKELEEPSAPVLYNVGGLIRPREIPTKDFDTIQRVTAETNKGMHRSAALLKKRIK